MEVSRMVGRRSLLVLAISAALTTPAPAEPAIRLSLDTSEAETVLDVLALRRSGREPTDEDWRKIFATEPYRRLRLREEGLGRPFTDGDFKEFVLGKELAGREEALRRTLAEWRTRDLTASARRVLAYLPANATIRATVYPVIKPKSNSFVFDPAGDAAIFLYLDPEESAERFENAVAHELHHIGFASIPDPDDSSTAELSEGARQAVKWMGAFGEGFAMLAAAGDTATHPHATSPAEDRARWDHDIANFDEDLGKLKGFFLDLIDGRLADESEIRRRAMDFFGIQGPWYTVGYRMAVMVEERHGRPALIDAMADPRRILPLYNAAAEELNRRDGGRRPLWPARLLESVGLK